MRIKLGKGVLTWNGAERRSDRYGAIYLIPEGHNSLTLEPSESLIDKRCATALIGEKGALIAVVVEARKSTHIGDLFRGFFPETPDVGEEIELGAGTLFTDPVGYPPGLQVGLRPDDDRSNDWLNPRQLYRAHEQSVELFFEPR